MTERAFKIKQARFTLFVALSGLLVAATYAGLVLDIFLDPAYSGLRQSVALTLAPIIFLLVGSFLLLRGWRIARVALAFVFTVLSISLLATCGYYWIKHELPFAALRLPAAGGLVFAILTYLLVFSRRLGMEQASLRSER